MRKYSRREKGDARPYRKQHPHHCDAAATRGRRHMAAAFIGMIKNLAPPQDIHQRPAAGEGGGENNGENRQRDK